MSKSPALWEIILDADNYLLDVFHEIEAARTLLNTDEIVPSIAVLSRIDEIERNTNNSYFQLEVALYAANEAMGKVNRMREQRDKAVAAYRALLEEFESFDE